jgi:CheY-like chemotaxis protein
MKAPEGVDILLVEDDANQVALIRQCIALLAGGFRVEVERTGSGALEAARAHAPRLILLDLRLPDLPGIEVLQALKGDPELAPTPVVVLSASRHPEDIEASLRSHAGGYLVKDADLARFLEKLEATTQFFLRASESPTG